MASAIHDIYYVWSSWCHHLPSVFFFSSLVSSSFLLSVARYFNLLAPSGVMTVVGLPEKTKPLGIFLQSIVVRPRGGLV